MLQRLRWWRERRRAAVELADREAHALLAAKGRAGALVDLAERLRQGEFGAHDRQKIAAIAQRVRRISPPPFKADAASRMIFTE